MFPSFFLITRSHTTACATALFGYEDNVKVSIEDSPATRLFTVADDDVENTSAELRTKHKFDNWNFELSVKMKGFEAGNVNKI